ncbi:MBL fold metallo-hydrolase [Micromonospora sp. NPDC005707]|uniref:MBL fold metallo-hydrolase n=1 Tax=Micromonospora sp. NPDC005707 TaxID=3157050 RepID=UPI0033D6E429
MAGTWMVRIPDPLGADEEALRQGIIVAQWPELGDISRFRSRIEVRRGLAAAYPTKSIKGLGNYAGQLWRFLAEMKPGDYVAMPMRRLPKYMAVGRIAGRYRYRPEAPPGWRHTRAVEWINRSVPRAAAGADLCNRHVPPTMKISQLHADPDGHRLAELAHRRSDPGPRPLRKRLSKSPLSRDRVSVVDVGDGACSIIRTQYRGRESVLVVDCGSDSISPDEACDRLVDALDGRPEVIDTIVVTHFDADHYRGFVRLAERMRARGQRFESLRLISPRPPVVAPPFTAAYLAMELTVTGFRSLDLSLDLERVTEKGEFQYTPLARGNGFLAGERAYDVLWPPATLPSHLARGVRSAVSRFEQLAEQLTARGNNSLRDNFEAARNGGWLKPRHGDPETWTLNNAQLIDGEDLGEDMYENDHDDGGALDITRLNVPGELHDAFRGVWNAMRRANNNMSLVFEDAEPGRLIVFGDAGPPVLRWLTNTDLHPAHYALMLAPHHGTHPLPLALQVTADLCVGQNGNRRVHLWSRHRSTHHNHGRCVSSTSGTHHLLL